MTISSRTPEGIPGKCPTCGGLIRVDPSRPTGDVPCPTCGALLWFVVVEGAVRMYLHGKVSLRKRQIIKALTVASSDSLDLVELVMELEEEFRDKMEAIPVNRMQEIRSIGALIDFIIRELPD